MFKYNYFDNFYFKENFNYKYFLNNYSTKSFSVQKN